MRERCPPSRAGLVGTATIFGDATSSRPRGRLAQDCLVYGESARRRSFPVLLHVGRFGTPLAAAGTLKLVYDFAIYRSFRKVPQRKRRPRGRDEDRKSVV